MRQTLHRFVTLLWHFKIKPYCYHQKIEANLWYIYGQKILLVYANVMGPLISGQAAPGIDIKLGDITSDMVLINFYSPFH